MRVNTLSPIIIKFMPTRWLHLQRAGLFFEGVLTSEVIMKGITKLAREVHSLESEAAVLYDRGQGYMHEGQMLEQAACDVRVDFLKGLGYKLTEGEDFVYLKFKGKPISQDTGGHDGFEFMIREAMQHAGCLKQWDAACKKITSEVRHD